MFAQALSGLPHTAIEEEGKPMSNILKVFIVLNFVLAVVFVATAATLLGKADNWKEKHDTLKVSSDETIKKLNKKTDSLTAQVAEEKTARTAAIDERDDLQATAKSVQGQLTEKKRDYEKLNNNLSEIKESYKTQATNMKQAMTDRETYEKRMTTAEAKARTAINTKETAEDESRRLETVIAQQKEAIAQFERDITEVRKELAHNKNLVMIAVERGFNIANLIHAPAVDAVVQKVNPDMEYVMLSVGREDKVTKGMRFYVSRNASFVGEVQVDNVYPKACSASFVTPNMEVQAGDQATTRL